MFKFPDNGIKSRQELKKLLSTFWSSVFTDQDDLNAIMKTTARMADQHSINYRESKECTVRQEVPVFHSELFHPLTIKRSERGVVSPLYDDGFVYDDGLIYDQSSSVDRNVWEIGKKWAGISVIVDSLDRPGLFLIEGIDFSISGTRIEFVDNPFTLAGFDSSEYDDELELILVDCLEDKFFIRDHWGYIVDLNIDESSPHYKDAVNAIMDSVTAGPNSGSTRLLSESASGIDMVRNDSETVETIRTGPNYITVVTDLESYRFPLGSEILVSEGQVVAFGDPLVDRLKIIRFNRGLDYESTGPIVVGEGLLLTGGQLVFHDHDVPVTTIGSYTNGHPKIRFDIGGHPVVVEAFWDAVDEQTETLGVSLMQYLSGSDSPSAADVPIYINPASFLKKHVLRWSTLFVRMRPIVDSLSRAHLLSRISQNIRKSIPAEGTAIIVVDLDVINHDSFQAGDPTIDSYVPAELITGSFDSNEGRTTAASIKGVYL